MVRSAIAGVACVHLATVRISNHEGRLHPSRRVAEFIIEPRIRADPLATLLRMRRSGPIQLSNSQVFLSRERMSAGVSRPSFPFAPSQKRKRSAATAHDFVWRARTRARTGRAKTGLALRRSTAAFSDLGSPLFREPASRATMREPGGELRYSNPGLRSEPGGYRPRSPGTTAANRGRGHRFPLTSVFACRRSSGERERVEYSRFLISVNGKIYPQHFLSLTARRPSSP